MLESLESRTLFAATLTDASALAAPTGAESPFSLNYTKIKFDKVASHDLNFSKVKTQDFNFSKVSTQDFHFVMRMPKASPKL